ncbi:B12-binding domain-containing protein [Aeromicrobium yanjiei]|uniref:B12-binding domain-containing protein n=1 Tax=Aeromicrobium yanjiei TaxID=2662028 RepID=A0A5Q2MGA4_9ACTN|nr:B12-binding domain-containing protein [Aeromicrobium yanjiei]QGG40759.1 hypothetical protein GEV26_04925 [Aeromicrobium yanjiei]
MKSLTASADQYVRAVDAFDPRAASDLVVALLDEGAPMIEIIKHVLGPAQVRTGRLWETGRWSVADEHVATSVTDSALSALTYAATPRAEVPTHHVAVACAEGEWHSMPARMAAAIAGATGRVRVTMLGPSMPARHLHRRLSAGDIDVLALSCTMPTNLIGAAGCVAAAHDAGVPVIAGGRAFGDSPRRADAIGADRWAHDAELILGTPPALTGRSRDVSAEILMLDAPDEATVSAAQDRMMAAFPELSSMTAYQHARTREDLVWILRHTAAAVLTDDPSIVQHLLTWLCDLLREDVPASTIITTAELMADTLEPLSPTGAAMLRRGAGSVPA